MLTQKGFQFSDKQSIAAVSVNSAEVVDLGGGGDPNLAPYLVLKVDENFAGSGTLTATVQVSDDGITFANLFSTQAFIAPELKVSRELAALQMPKGLKRYARVLYTASAAFTAGKVSAWVEFKRDNPLVK